MVSFPRCEACGMPMSHPSQHGNGDTSHPYCLYCTDTAGQLRTRGEIREGMIHYVMKSENWTRDKAEIEVDRQMTHLPAWQPAH